MTRAGINGLGHRVRLALRAARGWPGMDFAHGNESKDGPEAAALPVGFDPGYRRWPHQVGSIDCSANRLIELARKPGQGL